MAQQEPFAVVIKAAVEEARRRGNRRIGTEHLLLGLLHDTDSRPVRALGVDLETGRAALDALDKAALKAIGLDLGDARPPVRTHPPLTLTALTSSARTVVRHAVKVTTRKTRRTAAPDHLLLALLDCERPDPVVDLLAALDIDRPAVRATMAS